MNSEFKLGFVCVGGNKCGTTWLSEMLRQHPALNVSLNKEPHFFSKNYGLGVEWYKKNWETKPGIMGEFSTTYLYHSDAITRLATDFPRVKVIVSLRNPLDRSLSHFRHLLRSEATVSAHDVLTRNRQIVQNSFYFDRIRELQKHFGEEQVKMVFFDEIKESPLKLLKGVFAFLEVEEGFAPENVMKVIGRGFDPKSKQLDTIRSNTYYALKKLGLYRLILLIKRTGLPELLKRYNKTKKNGNALETLLMEYVPEFKRDLLKVKGLPVVHDSKYIDLWIADLDQAHNEYQKSG